MPEPAAELFASTASYYARFRPGYTPECYTYLADHFGLDGTSRVLDVGTGTGALALGLAGVAAEVVGLDPEAGMLAEANALADAAGIGNIRWLHAAATDLADHDLGRFHLVTFGQSFHWTDRADVLATLNGMVDETGGVAVIGSPAPDTVPTPEWSAIVTEVRTRYLGPARRAGSGTYRHPRERHEQVVARSPFSDVTIRHWDRTIVRTLDEVVGLQFSYSYSSPALLGANAEAFAADLRTTLTELSPSGEFAEYVRTEAIIATRPR